MTTETSVVSLGTSLGVLVNKDKLTPKQLIYLIEVRRLQVAKMLDRLTLPTVGGLLIAGGGGAMMHNHTIIMDDPMFHRGAIEPKAQVLEITRTGFRDDQWPDWKFQTNIITLDRRSGNWVIVCVTYRQEQDGGRKVALDVSTWASDTESVLEWCKNQYSQAQIWFGLANAFRVCCQFKEAQLKACLEVVTWFDTEERVFHAHRAVAE